MRGRERYEVRKKKLNYQLSQKFKLLEYSTFNHLSIYSNTPLTCGPKLPFQ